MRVISRIAAVVSAVSLFAVLTAAPAHAAGDPFGHTYLSTSVKKDGERYDLWNDKSLRVDLSEESGGGGTIGWHASCNAFFAEFELDGNRLIIESAGYTLMECVPTRRMRQDRFFERFFEADPTYVASGNRLKMMARDVVVKLEKRN